MKGKVTLIGAGCGDYDLITLRGKRALERCDTVIYDALIDERLLDNCREGRRRYASASVRGGTRPSRRKSTNCWCARRARGET